MTKICTTIEQSKKLVELGLKDDTADMCWEVAYINHAYDITYCEKPKVGYKKLNGSHPAWSLSALLDIIPDSDKRKENYVSVEHRSHFNHVRLVNCWDGGLHSEYSNGDLLDVLYDMICWMLEHNKL